MEWVGGWVGGRKAFSYTYLAEDVEEGVVGQDDEGLGHEEGAGFHPGGDVEACLLLYGGRGWVGGWVGGNGERRRFVLYD